MCTIKTKKVKSRLNHLEKELPFASRLIYDFARYFAKELRDNVSPMDVAGTLQSSFYKLKIGKILANEEKVDARLLKQTELFYTMIRQRISEIIEISFHKDFAKKIFQVIRIQNELLKILKKSEKIIPLPNNV